MAEVQKEVRWLKLLGAIMAAALMIAGTFAIGGYVIWKWMQRLVGR